MVRAAKRLAVGLMVAAFTLGLMAFAIFGSIIADDQDRAVAVLSHVCEDIGVTTIYNGMAYKTCKRLDGTVWSVPQAAAGSGR